MSYDAKIVDVQVYLVEKAIKGNFADSTRNVETIGYCITDITTDNGLHGFGLTYHEVGGEAIREFILKALKPKLIGRSPFETEAIWEECFHYIRGVGRKGLAFCGYSTVDIAMWDLKGKLLNMPLYKLLGGVKTQIPIYASGGWTSYSLEELVEEAREMVRRGYTKIKLKVGVEGGNNPNEDVRRIRAVRDAIGPDIGLMLDANNVWRSATAVQVANRLRDLDILLFEEPVFADDIPGLAHFKQSTDIPLATGEHEYTKFGIRDLILANAVDYVQCDVTRCGGFTEILKIIGMTQAWNLAFAPHGMEYMHMHLMSAAPNAPFLERLFMFEDVSAMVFKDAPQPKNGYLELPNKPGLGMELDYDNIKEVCVKF
ncbi:mandelate racemase/muconate lactonizing enzyme family protein [Marasmitruncus massiliensis]|uniref:mandelate racemase/muconate lactonizing enzyme family protein n=1 Tax=Marasmitruncus massiliensis TaxID=1944642 RepID=UPI000C7C5460|nr:mandelate racemase/muconate lactonizing enzyme family protein [Marasmitruncus massiliensis]